MKIGIPMAIKVVGGDGIICCFLELTTHASFSSYCLSMQVNNRTQHTHTHTHTLVHVGFNRTHCCM